MTNIYGILSEGRLAEALDLLVTKLQPLGNEGLNEALAMLRRDYEESLRLYVGNDGSVENAENFLRRTYAVNDRANRTIRIQKNSYSEYAKAMSQDGEFYRIWTSDLWTEYECEAFQTLQSPQTVSALTLSLLELFDERKVMALFDAYESDDNTVSMRALVGLIIILIRYDGRLKFYPDITSRLSLLTEGERFVREFFACLTQLQYSKLTDSVTDKMRNDIMPSLLHNMMKGFKGKDGKDSEEGKEKLDAEQINDILTGNGENPDWIQSEGFDREFEKKINKMAKMQTEGADVYMTTFSMLKNFDFFRELPNWFKPFDINLDSDSQLDRPGLFSKLIRVAPFCDSDKYSFYYSLDKVVSKGQDSISEQIAAQLDAEQMEDVFGDKPGFTSEESAARTEISRLYIYDLYRFFTLYPGRSQFFNPFDPKLSGFTPLHRYSMQCLMGERDELIALAEFFMRKGCYTESRELFLFLDPKECEDDADLWQKIGFCEQKLAMPEALDTLLVADRLSPESRWNHQHIVQVAFEQRKYETAIAYLDRLMEDDSENLKFVLKKAECLFALERYEESVPYLYKVNYLDEDSRLGREMLAWGLLMTRKFERAQALYEELEDDILLGHTALAQGNRREALNHYRLAYEECLRGSSSSNGSNSSAEFAQRFWNLGQYLDRVGVEKKTVKLLYDATLLGIKG